MSMKDAWDIDRRRRDWASEHDWFDCAVPIPSTGTFRIVVKDADVPPGSRSFERFDELRAWAGY